MMNTKTNALAIVNAPEWAVKNDGVKKLQEAAVMQLGAIAEMENRAAMGGILAGLTLLRVKASMAHGAFGKWLSQIRTSGANLPKINHRQANYYMSLALVFLERAKVTKPDLLALPGDQMALDLADNHEARAFMEKLRKFTGEHSLNELLIKHDIKAVGLKKELSAKKAREDAVPVTADDLYEQSRDEIGDALLRLETLLLEENRLQYLAGHPELLGVVDSLETLAKKVRKAAAPLLEDAKAAKKKS